MVQGHPTTSLSAYTSAGDNATYEVVLLDNNEELLQYDASSADISDGTNAHSHAVY